MELARDLLDANACLLDPADWTEDIACRIAGMKRPRAGNTG